LQELYIGLNTYRRLRDGALANLRDSSSGGARLALVERGVADDTELEPFGDDEEDDDFGDDED
jgi:hypothetical protein